MNFYVTAQVKTHHLLNYGCTVCENSVNSLKKCQITEEETGAIGKMMKTIKPP